MMYRRAIYWACVIVVATLLLLTVNANSSAEFQVYGLASVGVIMILGYLVRDVLPVNPFIVCLLIAGVVLLMFLGVKALSLIGPIATLGITMALLVAVIGGHYRRGEKLRDRRALSGLCTHCGYDLRASPDRCPECGAEVNDELTRRRRIRAELAAKRQQEQSPTQP